MAKGKKSTPSKAPRKSPTGRGPAPALGPGPTTQAAAPKSGIDILKENIQRVGKDGLINMLNDVKNARPEDWQNPERVKEMARRFAQQFHIPVSEDRLNAFAKAFQDATRTGRPVTVEELAKKYGGDRVDDATIKEMKKYIPKVP
ncbi:hypothetical protein [Kyrpidia tusciae]|uniref:Uncharacterized protein n=1 Tax=Kyrpidia tusciae (strain DSM 2912 / NBRC 15312 / T2) TaxID=562970 RepID=D5WXB3_KYRT2|nr:hypothetical protein [Kyrpidia tusciae]ADG07894.1 conserved hypothetical protein [Kyrpidia tusciae DSM 2912]